MTTNFRDRDERITAKSQTPADDTTTALPPVDSPATDKSVTAGVMRKFATGATRNNDVMRLDYEGFLSPLVLRHYAEYMNKNRVQADGSIRASDNWQLGIPFDSYMKSMWRHFMDVWSNHRRVPEDVTPDQVEALSALLFNVMGYMHELVKARREAESQ